VIYLPVAAQRVRIVSPCHSCGGSRLKIRNKNCKYKTKRVVAEIMDESRFEELLLSAAEAPNIKICTELLKELKTAGNPLPAAIAGRLELLWENWGSSLSVEQSDFTVDVAALGGEENAVFRKVFSTAVKHLLPPYLAHPPVLKALGLRDEKRPAVEVAARLRRLQALKSGAVVFLPESKRWGVAGVVDGISGTLPMSAFAGAGSSAMVPLEVVLNNLVVLNFGPELSKLVTPGAAPIAADSFRAAVERRAALPVAADVMRDMARYGCGRLMDGAHFEAYWQKRGTDAVAAAGAGSSGERRSCNGRSLKEISELLAAEEKAGDNSIFGAAEIEEVRGFFERLRPDTAQREAKLLAQVVGGLAARTDEALLGDLYQIMAGKMPFWPAAPERAPYPQLAVWGALAAKSLTPLAKLTAAGFDDAYMGALAIRLPLKALNCVAPVIEPEVIENALVAGRGCGADLLIWVWKNRKKLGKSNLLKLISIDNVSRTLSSEDPPKEWGAARRDLHRLLMEDASFQEALLISAGSMEALSSILASALYLSAGERHSLMVKLARISPELQSHLESGAGRKILDSSAEGSVPEAPAASGNISSIRSQLRMRQELDDIINIHVPENREALKTARAHGDFRENSEFDAAKERRNQLTRRRNELERELATLQTITMGDVNVSDVAVIGSEIDLEYADGAKETYWLLGAWDGDPERKFLSYRARLGGAVINRRKGDTFEVPGGKKCTLTAVRPLPAEIIDELDH